MIEVVGILVGIFAMLFSPLHVCFCDVHADSFMAARSTIQIIISEYLWMIEIVNYYIRLLAVSRAIDERQFFSECAQEHSY